MPTRKIVRRKGRKTYGLKRMIRRFPKNPMLRLKRTGGMDVLVKPSSGLQHCCNHGIPYDATAGNLMIPFQLGLTPNFGELEALFDEYRILKVISKFTFSITSLTLTNNTGAGGGLGIHAMPMIHWVIDDDDSTSLTTLNEYREYNTYRSARLDKIVTITSYPRIAAMGSQDVTTGYYKPPKKSWVNMAHHNMNHFGLKYVIDPVLVDGTTNIGKLRIDHTYFIECRSTR